jgi:hypothetical protein
LSAMLRRRSRAAFKAASSARLRRMLSADLLARVRVA